MNLNHIAFIGLLAFVYLWLIPGKIRIWFLVISSIFAIYWLQFAMSKGIDAFLFPSATLVLTLLTWWGVRPDHIAIQLEDRIAIGLVFVAILISFVVYLGHGEIFLLKISGVFESWRAFSIGMALFILLGVGYKSCTHGSSIKKQNLWLIGLILIIFMLVKQQTFLLNKVSQLETLLGMPEVEKPTIIWLGYSYFAFRIIHVIRDHHSGKLPEFSFCEFIVYAIFFPAYTAGPIDRVGRFVKDLREIEYVSLEKATLVGAGLSRVLIGIFKKIVVADAFGIFAMSPNSLQVNSSVGWTWLTLYAFAFQLYFDFSGYTDVAIGLGQLFGIKMPENFDRPYLKQNLSSFWNSWHMTLTNWVRAYVFIPLVRNIKLMKQIRLPEFFISLIGFLTTMILLGLWHGFTINFVIWGLWHGFGLFFYKLWNDQNLKWNSRKETTPILKFIGSAFGIFLTFHYVVLGWVWFALPSLELSVRAFYYLFGVQL